MTIVERSKVGKLIPLINRHTYCTWSRLYLIYTMVSRPKRVSAVSYAEPSPPSSVSGSGEDEIDSEVEDEEEDAEGEVEFEAEGEEDGEGEEEDVEDQMDLDAEGEEDEECMFIFNFVNDGDRTDDSTYTCTCQDSI